MKLCTTYADSKEHGQHTIFGKALPHGCTRIADGNKQRTNMTRGDRLLTYREFGGIWAIILCVVIAVQMLTGCATGPRCEYNTDSFTIIVADRGEVQQAWEKYANHKRQQVRGFYDAFTRTMWVQRGYGGLPCFETLGHEVWHLEELGGQFHE
jgi:hypothetical protein